MKKIRCFKYRPLYLDSKDGRVPHPFTEQIFKNNELWYSAPKDFNDPFDCNLRLHARGSTDEDWIEHLRGIPNKTVEEARAAEIAIKNRSWRIEDARLQYPNPRKSALKDIV